MINVLNIVSSLGGGGVENMLYNYYSHIDRDMVRFDFVVHGNNKGILESKFSSLGSRIYCVTPKKVSLLKNMFEINKILKRGNYDVVHCHQNFSNFTSLFLAKINGIPIRISHAHGFKDEMSLFNKFKEKCLRLLNNLFANYYFACSLDAGKWLFGQNWMPNKRNIIMKNIIDINKFFYNAEIREEYRKLFNLGNKKVLLHVGRFSEEKNHIFIIDIMEELSKRSDNYVLLLVGDGYLEKSIKKYVDVKGLADKIIFLGVRLDVAELMNAADLFLFPSKNEGLGMVVIEAQATGLPVVSSDRVPQETKITNLINYISINNINDWVDFIIKFKIIDRKSHKVDVENAGYSINNQVAYYYNWLVNVLGNRT